MPKCHRKTLRVLLGVSLSALMIHQITAQDRRTLTAAEAREIIDSGNREWGRARLALDKKTFETMLAPDFYIQQPGRRLGRQEYIDSISADRPGAKLTRFNATVLTVRPTEDGWVAVVQEKLEFEDKGYSLRIIRSGWKQEGNGWVITFSEFIGHENWTGGARPPFPDWGSTPEL